LLAARQDWPALRDFGARRARLLGGDLLELARGQGAQEMRAYFNLSDRSQDVPEPGAGLAELFRSESGRYGGGRGEGDERLRVLPYECVVFGPRGWRKSD
jgi:hypothetical protein